jgi:hypothetical protein
MRARINERFTQLHSERTAAEAKLAALATGQPKAADPAILDEVPYAGDLIPELLPALKARLFAVSDLAIVWNKTGSQATVTADATLAALPEILDPTQPGYHDTRRTHRIRSRWGIGATPYSDTKGTSTHPATPSRRLTYRGAAGIPQRIAISGSR